jgi:hypothetical protein
VPPGSVGAANSRPRRLAGPNADQARLAVGVLAGPLLPAVRTSCPVPALAAGSRLAGPVPTLASWPAGRALADLWSATALLTTALLTKVLLTTAVLTTAEC